MNPKDDAEAWRNYLRIRGEESTPLQFFMLPMELPPHTRRRDYLEGEDKYEIGTTSAYAEKRGHAKQNA